MLGSTCEQRTWVNDPLDESAQNRRPGAFRLHNGITHGGHDYRLDVLREVDASSSETDRVILDPLEVVRMVPFPCLKRPREGAYVGPRRKIAVLLSIKCLVERLCWSGRRLRTDTVELRVPFPPRNVGGAPPSVEWYGPSCHPDGSGIVEEWSKVFVLVSNLNPQRNLDGQSGILSPRVCLVERKVSEEEPQRVQECGLARPIRAD